MLHYPSIYRCTYPVFCIFGLAGNSLTLVVLRSRKLGGVMSAFLAALAVSDTTDSTTLPCCRLVVRPVAQQIHYKTTTSCRNEICKFAACERVEGNRQVNKSTTSPRQFVCNKSTTIEVSRARTPLSRFVVELVVD